MGLQAYRQHIGEHLDQQSRVQAMTLTFPILDFGEYWREFPTDTP
jgi:hypothetical protein